MPVLLRRILPLLFVITSLAGPTHAEIRQTDAAVTDVDSSSDPINEPQLAIQRLIVDAQQHCLFMTKKQRPDKKTARFNLLPNRRYHVQVSGSAFLSSDTGQKSDPIPGAVVFYCTNEQDGFATKTDIIRPGDEISFTTPKQEGNDLFLSAFFIDYWPESDNRGQYELAIQSTPINPPASKGPAEDMAQTLNINFGMNPLDEQFHGVLEDSATYWNLIDVGELKKTGLRFANGEISDIEVEVSPNDGEWGIAGLTGAYHAYIYDNSRAVDLSVTVRSLPPGLYEAIVVAHGDAPDQNAAIEIQSGPTLMTGKSTLNDGTWNFRTNEFQDENQFVRYFVEVLPGTPLVITSKRDGSNLSMFNAIQLRRAN